ncbi:MAG: molybdopterin molybdotransferase MoeA [Chloroflexota bacterium]|nr:molybdopterin molybdotransferase MoeA [Chloroflexota bacterium]
MSRMLDVDSALKVVLRAFAPLPAEAVAPRDAANRVLAYDVVARDNVPPFRNSAMDGYAVRSVDTLAASRSDPIELPVAANVAAGDRSAARLEVGHAIRIMTGAPMPDGADAVVRFEEIDELQTGEDRDRRSVRVYSAAAPRENIREMGEDVSAGDVVATRGTVLRPAMVGLIAATGERSVLVHRRPVIGVLSTGNELVDAGSTLKPGTIRDSNALVIAAMAREWGARVRLLGIARDTVSEFTACLSDASELDLVVTTGGVSRGDFDLVKDVLRAVGDIAIWQVRMKPGKPLAFGTVAGTPLLGLPGNPVAAAVSFMLFGRPAVRTMLGVADVTPRTVEVQSADPIENRGRRRHYVRVTLKPQEQGPAIASVVGDQGAGILSSLAAADALLIVPEDVERVEPGMRLRAMVL